MYNPLNYESKRPSTAVSTDPSDPSEVPACGGIGRLKYSLLQICLVFALGLGALALDAMSLPINYAPTIGLIVFLGWIICACWATVQRFKNMGYRWYYLFMSFVPLANLYYGVLLNIGPEGYAIHKKGDKWTKYILWSFVVVFILSVFVPSLITALERRPL